MLVRIVGDSPHQAEGVTRRARDTPPEFLDRGDANGCLCGSICAWIRRTTRRPASGSSSSRLPMLSGRPSWGRLRHLRRIYRHPRRTHRRRTYRTPRRPTVRHRRSVRPTSGRRRRSSCARARDLRRVAVDTSRAAGYDLQALYAECPRNAAAVRRDVSGDRRDRPSGTPVQVVAELVGAGAIGQAGALRRTNSSLSGSPCMMRMLADNQQSAVSTFPHR